jgi:heptosyltransferase-1
MPEQSIAIIRLSALGDIIHTIPAFNLIRQAFPDASISWIADTAGAKLLQNFQGIDHIIELKLKNNSLQSKYQQLKHLIDHYRGTFDLIIDFQGLLKSALIGFLLKGKSIGFHSTNLREKLARLFYHHQADFFPEDNQHVIYKNMQLIKPLTNCQGDSVQYPLKPLTDSSELEQFYRQNDLRPGHYLILNIGATWSTKLLDTDTYKEIIYGLQTENKIILLWGNLQEKELARQIADHTDAVPAIFLNFSDLILFIKNSAITITSDTLALHIADMVNTPTVGLFGPTSPFRNGSLLPSSIAVYKKTGCGFCYKKKCDKMVCMKQLKSTDIIKEIKKLHESLY